VIYRQGPGPARIDVHRADLTMVEVAGDCLDAAACEDLFARNGRIRRIDVHLGAGFRAYPAAH